jgi:RNA polymerase sigma-70 factor, ECF subfamily
VDPSNPQSFEKWTSLVEGIRAGDQSAVEDLYNYFSRGVRLLLCRQLGLENLDDRVHDLFLVVLEAIQDGTLREPERLLGFIRTVVRRHTANAIMNNVGERREKLDVTEQWGLAAMDRNPEQQAILDQRVEIIRQTLTELSERDREILTRFYLHEQSAEEICEQMGLNETQFRLLKSRAKARFGESGRRRMQSAGLRVISLRKAAGAGH